MCITKEKFEEIKAKHNTLLVLEDDVDEALTFVRELLEAEADALKVSEPYAVTSIKKLEDAAYQVFEMSGESSAEEIGE